MYRWQTCRVCPVTVSHKTSGMLRKVGRYLRQRAWHLLHAKAGDEFDAKNGCPRCGRSFKHNDYMGFRANGFDAWECPRCGRITPFSEVAKRRREETP